MHLFSPPFCDGQMYNKEFTPKMVEMVDRHCAKGPLGIYAYLLVITFVGTVEIRTLYVNI